MPGNSSKKPAKHATRATTSAPAAGTAGATDPPSGEPEVAGGNETFATPQAQGIGRQQAGVTDGKVDQSEEDSKTELELYRGLVQQLEARLQGLEDRLGQDAQSDNESVGRASSGAPVRTYEEMLEYYLERAPDARAARLPFEGRREVLYRLPTPEVGRKRD